MTTVSFKVTSEEAKLISAIVKRAVTLAAGSGIDYSKLDASMDITATHANGNPLRLQELLDADNANFGHDVLGIRRFINRNTGQLTGSFLPRFTARGDGK